MTLMFLKAYFQLIGFERDLARGDFAGLHEKVRQTQVSADPCPPDELVLRICSAVDWACVWYWKQVLCLQRSAATTCLLRRYGLPAQLVIGVRQLPFRAHAWVELEGRVINDKPHRVNTYHVLERC